MNTILRLLLLSCFWFAGIYLSAETPDLTWVKDVGARKFPTKTQTYNVTDYGAVADGITMNTKAIQKAIDDCSSKGGGIVTFSKGQYLTGSIYLKEGVHFVVPKGTTLLGSTDLRDYPEMHTRVAGIEMVWPSALINILDQKNVMISGDGIVHGQGKVFWDSYWELRKEYEKKGLRWIVDYDSKRARTLLVSESSDVTIEGITFQQAGFWTIQLLYSSYCTVDGVIVQNNVGGHGPSTDGVDVDSSSHILIENCDIDCNDDNFCLKAGRDADGLRVNRPCEYVVIRNCISRAGGGLLTCGSETSGGIRYVLADGLKAKGTNVGIRLKSAMNRGGTTEHIYVRNVEMDEVGTVFEATMNWNPAYSYSKLPKEYEGKQLPPHWEKMLEKVSPKDGTPYFQYVYLSDFKVTNSQTFMNVWGSKESMMRSFHFSNIDADVEKIGQVNYAKDWTFSDLRIKAKDLQPIQINNSQEVQFPELKGYTDVKFPNQLKGKNNSSTILTAEHPEFSFLLPEMAGNLKFGIIDGKKSKWLSESKTKEYKQVGNQIIYTLSDPIIGKGKLVVETISLSNTDGIVVEVSTENIPENLQLFWSFGGVYGKELTPNETKTLNPLYCRDNVFSVEQTAFTVYYGESMKLKVIQGVMPVTSEIQLSDAYVQGSPLTFFESGKKTDSPALGAVLTLKNNSKEYFCIYKQNDKADYNHYMLPALFKQEKSK
ncbi:MAG: DUF4450 domain-containing protein [Dysgonomonas sp.]|nr:DUF4450 domain-containing protein [Dysgonomonas sp.]